MILTHFSKNSKNEIRYAVEWLEKIPCHFILLYIDLEGVDFTEKPVYDFGTIILVEKEPSAINQKLKNLERFPAQINPKNKHHRFTTVLEDGYFLQSIRHLVKEAETSHMVMGTPGASKLQEFLIGTHSEDVITKVECDVLVVPENTTFKG